MPVSDLQEAIDLLNRDEPGAAIAVLERLVDRLPLYVAAHVLLARAYEVAGRRTDALQRWQQAYFLMPNSPTVGRGLQRVLNAPRSADGDRPAQEGPAAHAAGAEPAGVVAVPAGGDGEPVEDERDAPARSTDARRLARQADFEDLDHLIEQLESARIVPRPNLEAVPMPELEDDIEDVVSETLARIYAAQRQFDEAARIYELLAAQQPQQAAAFLKKASEMRARAAED